MEPLHSSPAPVDQTQNQPRNDPSRQQSPRPTQRPGWADLRHPEVLLSSWFGSGLLRPAPGSWGSLAALPCVALLQLAGGGTGALLVFITLVSLLGWAAATASLRRYGGEDPGWVVIDEVAGQAIVLLGAGPRWTDWLLAFALFRLFDITKPGPVGWADQKLGGGLGIMADDLIAGLLGLAVLAALRYTGLLALI